MYIIKHTDGRTEPGIETLQEAETIVRAEYGEGAVIGHSGDLSDGGDRTLCWVDEDAADNDDGTHACCSIRREVRP